MDNNSPEFCECSGNYVVSQWVDYDSTRIIRKSKTQTEVCKKWFDSIAFLFCADGWVATISPVSLPALPVSWSSDSTVFQITINSQLFSSASPLVYHFQSTLKQRWEATNPLYWRESSWNDGNFCVGVAFRMCAYLA